MDLGLTEDQKLLADVVARFVANEVELGRATNRYWLNGEDNAHLYRAVARAGWLGLLVPEVHGGSEVSVMDAAIAYEGFGAAPLPAPVFTAAVLTPEIVTIGGSDEQRASLLPAICSGDAVAALALSDDPTESWGPQSVTTTAVADGAELVVSGEKPFVFDGPHANLFICAARTEAGVTLVVVERDRPGVTVAPRTGLLSSTAAVRLDAVRVERSALLGTPGEGWSILERSSIRAIPVLGAFVVGACQAIFDAVVEYTRERRAFGQPIGRFQRVQDHVVELANHLDAARWIVYETAWRIDRGDVATGFVHEAKAVACEAYYQVVNQAHKVYAGPGTDLDHQLMAHHAASRVFYQFLGDPAFHKRKMMDALFPTG